jgi:soluble lytic murein transglycosylase-like protein
MLAGHPTQVTRWLSTAAAHPHTFYGLLARETLGVDAGLELRDPMLHEQDGLSLVALPAGARAVALLRVDQLRRAEKELAGLNTDDTGVARAIVALANRGNMPRLSLRLGNQAIGLDRAERDAAIYPIPAWVPHDGYDVDRALIYALIRRESSFNPKARNPSGASGLMQLMPATAKSVADNRQAAQRMFEPETNITLGQNYIRQLMSDSTVGESLIMLIASYNAGPGNAAKWRRGLSEDDPLLFIESLPSRETRIFVESVLADLWIYRMRLGQSTASLAELASGGWPMYLAHDNRGLSVATVTRSP